MASQFGNYSWYSTKHLTVDGLCAASVIFTTLSFELVWAPAGAGAGSEQRSRLTLAREVGSDSADVFKACMGRGTRKGMVVSMIGEYAASTTSLVVAGLSSKLTNAYITRYAQYSQTAPSADAGVAYVPWEEISISYDHLAVSALPASAAGQSAPTTGNQNGDKIWYSVTGLCQASTGFMKMAFEMDSTPAEMPASRIWGRSPVTLSRRVGTDSPDVFSAYAGHGTLAEVEVNMWAPVIKAGSGIGQIALSTSTKLGNARVTRYSQYSVQQTKAGGTLQENETWEEISLTYDSISVNTPVAGATPGVAG